MGRTASKLHLRKADQRYYVDIDGVKVGWVAKGSDKRWTMWAKVDSSTKGTVVATNCKTRDEALYDGLGHLRIYNLGRVVCYDHDALCDTVVFLDEDVLVAIDQEITRRRYPWVAEALAGGAS